MVRRAADVMPFETTDAGLAPSLGPLVMASEFMTKRYSATEILPTHTRTALANL
jgi:hypothetical protein